MRGRLKKFADEFALLNGRLINPAQNFDGIGGVLVRGGRIVASGADVTPDNVSKNIPTIDCTGQWILPGLVDVGASIGEPGAEHRETFKSAGIAAATGGVTTIVTLPDTNPVVDDPALIDFIKRGRDMSAVHIHPLGAITKGCKGEEIAEIGLMNEVGAVGISDGRVSIANTLVMRRAMVYARDFDILMLHHAEDPYLSSAGVMHEGIYAEQLGLPGMPSAAEAMILARDVRLLRLTKARYHALYISCADSLDIIRRAKNDGLDITAGVSINNVCFTDNDIGDYRTFYKVKPPLRGPDERQTLIEGINSGVIDVLCSNHDPQDVETKRLPFEQAAFGAAGLETLLLGALRLIHNQECKAIDVVRAMSTRPAEILRLEKGTGTLNKNAPADIIVVDPETPWVLNADELKSKSKNTPFDHARLQGKVTRTFISGCVPDL